MDINNVLFAHSHPAIGGIPVKKYKEAMKEIANLSAYVDIDERAVPSQGKIYDLFDNSNNHSSGLIDTTKTAAISALTAGDTNIVSKVDTSNAPTSWFKTGQEITVQDDVNREVVTVTDGEVVSTTTTIDKSTPVTVVASAYTTSASARPQRLSNGWMMTCEWNGSDILYFQVDKQDGNGFVQLCYATTSSWDAGFSIISKGTMVYVLGAKVANSANYFTKFDALTVSNVNIIANFIYNLDSSQTSL